jgi:hypothetical protein
MDKVIFEHGNSLISPDNLRAELEQEQGETVEGPHYIVAAYPRPGAVLTQLVMQFVKETQERTGVAKVGTPALRSFVSSIFGKAG